MNRSEVLPSTAEQSIVRAGAGEHEAQFAMIDPVDKKPVALDVEFAESRPFAFHRGRHATAPTRIGAAHPDYHGDNA